MGRPVRHSVGVRDEEGSLPCGEISVFIRVHSRAFAVCLTHL
jgi:hypothetical protein